MFTVLQAGVNGPLINTAGALVGVGGALATWLWLRALHR
jgi:hypothetical protein